MAVYRTQYCLRCCRRADPAAEGNEDGSIRLKPPEQVNRKVARTLGLCIPQTLRATADEGAFRPSAGVCLWHKTDIELTPRATTDQI
jgi:hypothetical protein